MRKKKQHTFKEFAKGILRVSPCEATATINEITKAKNNYQKNHAQLLGKLLNPK